MLGVADEFGHWLDIEYVGYEEKARLPRPWLRPPTSSERAECAMAACAECGAYKAHDAFSRRQLRMKRPRCRGCIESTPVADDPESGLFGSESQRASTKLVLGSQFDKYWSQRRRLFARFDEGIRMDEEGWFSATPQCIAEHLASRCRCRVLLDICTGVGGNTVHFARTCGHVISVENCASRLACAKHNARV